MLRVRHVALLLSLITLAPAMAQQPYWQCAAFARQFSGIEIRGDAWTWWGQAEGRYQRGQRPRIGAVIAFVPGAQSMRLGHVATVTQILGDREVAITHANWSPINGTRGQIERDVVVRDVSAANDWSRVRVWYAPIGDLGTTAWAIDGFIYPDKAQGAFDSPVKMARATVAVPKLSYARLDTLRIGEAPKRGLLGADVIRLAALEARRPY